MVVSLISKARATRSYPVQDVAYTIYTSEDDLAEGARLVRARGCTSCHGDNLAGRLVSDELPVMRLVGTNLTGGLGSVIDEWSDEDIARVIRFGVLADGAPAFFMPSHEYFAIPERELGQIIGYLRSVEPIDNDPGESRLGIIGKALHVFGAMPMFPAEQIDHNATPPVIDTSNPISLGGYLADSCRGCHGAGLRGGALPGAPPSIPPPSNLTPHPSGLGAYDLDTFVTTMRTGIAPDGRTLSEFMPVQSFAAMTEDELEALWLFLNSLPSEEFGGR